MSGSVRCWGKNDHHQLGYASSATIGDDELPTAAGLVDVGGRVTQVATGLAYSCALLSTGKVRCWGDNLSGGLGYPGVTSVGDDETPAAAGDVDVGGKVTQLVVGMLHTCALLENGKVRCWGSPADGRLGYANANAIGDDETPAAAGDVDVGGKVTQLAAGDYSTCALLETGKVRCWGAGMRGELGHASLSDIGDDETPASAGDIDVGGVVTLVDVGFLHVCVTLDSGSVRCWGRGETAALGYGNLLVIGDDETPASAGDVRFF
jgi:alpha-tubulin suppressor-like RCC1 family protein